MPIQSGISLHKIRKSFSKDVVAVNDVSLDIAPGSFTTLLGPSGCGKTTLLRIVAGLETADSGQIVSGESVLFDGDQGIDIPARNRGIGLVFQSYALWPHMTVFENVTYGLRIKKISRDSLRSKVASVLKIVGMEGYGERYPSELSGGQQQRVSMARMLVMEPSILLMDEPLSNLDAKLRLSMRAELKRIHEEIGMTVLYVTHDQTEAMTLSSHIAIMRDGYVQQYASPAEIYHQSANLFVADFMGNPTVNAFEGVITTNGQGPALQLFDGQFELPIPAYAISKIKDGQELVMCIRPEQVTLSPENKALHVAARVYTILDSGAERHIYLKTPGNETVVARDDIHVPARTDDTIYLGFPADAIRLYDKETEEIIL